MTADQLACGVGHRHDAAARNCRGLERVVDRETEHDRQPIRQDAFERPEVLGDGLIGPLLLNVSPGANWHDHSVAFHLRPAVPDDAESIERVRVAGWRAAYRGIVADAFLDTMTGDVEQHRRYLTENMQGVQGVIEMVAVDDGNLVGWVVAGQSRDNDQEMSTPAEVYGCYIAPSHWRAGIGRELLERAVEELGDRGHRQITLWVLEDNQPARRFYESMGFKSDGARQDLDLGGLVSEVRYRRVLGFIN